MGEKEVNYGPDEMNDDEMIIYNVTVFKEKQEPKHSDVSTNTSGKFSKECVKKFQRLVRPNKNINSQSLLTNHFSFLFFLMVFLLALVVISESKTRAHAKSSEIAIEIQECARQYRINNCEERVPLTQEMCLNWEKCMTRNPNQIYYTEILSVMFASVLKSFIEHLHMNTIGFIILTVVLIYLLRTK